MKNDGGSMDVRRVETSLEPSSRISRIEARLTELDLWTIILEVLTSLLSFLRRRKASMTLSLFLSICLWIKHDPMKSRMKKKSDPSIDIQIELK